MKRPRIISNEEAGRLWVTYQRTGNVTATARLHQRNMNTVRRLFDRMGWLKIILHRKRTLDEVKKWHADYMTGLSLGAVGRKYGVSHANVAEHFQRRKLYIRPCKTLPHVGRRANGCYRRKRLVTQQQLEAIIARLSKPMIPPDLRTEWRTWPLERRGDFIRRIKVAHPSPKDMPNTPHSPNVARFDYATPAAWEILRELNKGLNSREWRCKMDLRSEGLIWRGQLFFWSSNWPEQGGAFYKGHNGPYVIGVGRPALAHLIYEEHHRCRLPAGSVVRVKDGNCNNLDPRNLVLITRNDLARENQAAHLQKNHARSRRCCCSALSRKGHNMIATTRSIKSGNGTGFSADEIRKTVEQCKAAGLLRGPDELSAIELKGELAAAFGKIHTVWMDITPAMAAAWLEHNLVNRDLKRDVVISYARQMASGDFIPTHQGIAFNDADELIDGQHKLSAIVMSGVTVRLMVTRGFPKNIPGKKYTTMDVIDCGRSRSVADQLKIQHGMKNGSLIAAVSSALATICNGERTRKLSVGQTLEVYETFKPAVNFVMERRSKEVGLRAVGVLAGFAFAISATAPKSDRIADMFESLVSGSGIKAGSPTARLRAFLMSDEAQLLSRSADRGLAELVMEAIWLELRGKTVAKLEPALDGVNHFRELQKARVRRVGAMFKLPKVKQP